jgi:penicillin amidase
LEILKKWNLKNDPSEIGATLFEGWWEQWMDLCWSDNFGKELRYPNRNRTLQIMLEKDNSDWFDFAQTKEIETGSHLVRKAFEQSMDSLVTRMGDHRKKSTGLAMGKF